MNKRLFTFSVSLILSCLIALPVLAGSPVPMPVPAATTLPPEADPAAQHSEVPAPAVSVLERFRTYAGPRTPAALKALFDAPVAADALQQPAIALSDGAATVMISVAAGTPDNRAPNVAFSGAQLISLKRGTAEGWDIEALPAAGALKASLILLTGSGTREIPFTVAPTLPRETDLSEPGFAAFLRAAGSAPQPGFDLNDDGRRDYVDDYIFTANYLTKPHPASPEPGAAQVLAPQPPAAAHSPAPPAADSPRDAAAQGAATPQTSYQRNLSIRKQRARELTERMRGKGPVPGTPAAVAPPAP